MTLGRKRKFSQKEFLQHYQACKSTKELAARMSLSLLAARRYIERHNKLPYPIKLKIHPLTLADEFRVDISVKDLAKKHKITMASVYYHLNKVVLYPDLFSIPGGHPVPKKLLDIKVINALNDNPSAIDDPRELLEIPGLSITIVESYWIQAFGYSLDDYREEE